MRQVFGAHAAPQGMCDNVINALKLLANQQKDGDSPVKMVVPDLPEKSRPRIMNGLRKCIAAESHAAAQIGDLEKDMTSKRVVKQKITTDFR